MIISATLILNTFLSSLLITFNWEPAENHSRIDHFLYENAKIRTTNVQALTFWSEWLWGWRNDLSATSTYQCFAGRMMPQVTLTRYSIWLYVCDQSTAAVQLQWDWRVKYRQGIKEANHWQRISSAPGLPGKLWTMKPCPRLKSTQNRDSPKAKPDIALSQATLRSTESWDEWSRRIHQWDIIWPVCTP